MSSLQIKVKEQFQLCLQFLGPNVVMLRNYDLLMIKRTCKEQQSKFKSLLVKNKYQKGSRASRRTKTRYKSIFAKGENRASRRAKTRFKSRFAKGEKQNM